ncbi:hypothetical protein FZC66_09360 [Priestia megaterium]|nr:hypothetical protein FZC66_09360 [Priestia megaterium]
MKLTVTEQAAKWYKDEMMLESNEYVRFFVRYGGCSNVQKGFSLGVNKDKPINIGVETEVNGLTFFVEDEDLWYFDGHDLKVTYSEEIKEPEFIYEA